MATTVKMLKKTALQIQSSSSYESNAMYLMPIVSGSIKVKPTLIADESINGDAFKDIPQQGTMEISGSFQVQTDVTSLGQLLEAAFGAVSSGAYSLGTNVKKVSIVILDGVKTNKYANVYIKSLKISGAVNKNILVDVEVVGVTAEVRDGTSFPTVTAYGDPLTFQEMTSSGYFRAGDCADALAAGDNLLIEDFEFTITTGFDSQWSNQKYSLTPVFGMVPPEVSGSFKIARHDADTFLAFRDANTRLQVEALIYKSATAQLKIQVPNCIVNPEISDDEIAKVSCPLIIGRNGTGTSYKNANMAFVTPIKVTVTNS